MLSNIIKKKHRKWSRSVYCFWFCVATLIALFLGVLGVQVPVVYLFAVIAAGGVLVILGRKSPLVVLLGFFLIGGGVGLWRVGEVVSPAALGTLSQWHDVGKVELRGVIEGSPDVRVADQRLTVRVETVKKLGDQAVVMVSGRVIAKLALYPTYREGELVVMRCALEEPFEMDDFSYKRYLAAQGIGSVCRSGVVVSHDGFAHVDFITKWLGVGKEYFLTVIHRTLAEPQASLLAGILIGERSAFPAELKTDFSRTGLTHLVAISGYNITIIVSAVYGMMRALRRTRTVAFGVTSMVIAMFAVITGGASATVRAAVMGVIAMGADYVGRPSQVRNTIVVSAVVMALLNPMILLADAGFQLSFLATIGLVYGTPIVTKWFAWMPEWLGWGREVLAQTTGALIVTVPLMMAQFGVVSVVAPLANLAVLPLMPLAMAVGFGWLVVASIAVPLSGGVLAAVVGGPIWLILGYVAYIAHTMSTWSWAAITVDLGVYRWAAVSLMYVIIMSGYFFIVRRNDRAPRELLASGAERP